MSSQFTSFRTRSRSAHPPCPAQLEQRSAEAESAHRLNGVHFTLLRRGGTLTGLLELWRVEKSGIITERYTTSVQHFNGARFVDGINFKLISSCVLILACCFDTDCGISHTLVAD